MADQGAGAVIRGLIIQRSHLMLTHTLQNTAHIQPDTAKGYCFVPRDLKREQCIDRVRQSHCGNSLYPV